VDPALTYHIDGTYTVTARAQADQLVIPLDMSLCLQYPDRHQEALFLQAMQLVFNAKVVTKLRWYESSFFRMVITVAAIVVTVTTGQGQVATWAAAFAAGGISALAFAVLVTVVKAIAVNTALKAAVKEMGLENALLLAAVTTLVSLYAGQGFSSTPGAPWASDLLRVSTGLAKAISAQVSDLIGEYQGKQQAFNLMAEQQWEELEEVRKLLDVAGLVDPFTFVGNRPLTILGESPESFYNRTVHAGNIGPLAFDAIEFHVDNALKLPTINDTLGGVI